MGEVAEMFDVNASLIRFWESKFDILKPHKNKKGNRMFTPADVDNLKLIHHLVKEKGMTLSGAQKRLKENPQGTSRDMEITDRLLSIKAILMELRQELGEDNDEIYRETDVHYDEEPTSAHAIAVQTAPPVQIAGPAFADAILVQAATSEQSATSTISVHSVPVQAVPPVQTTDPVYVQVVPLVQPHSAASTASASIAPSAQTALYSAYEVPVQTADPTSVHADDITDEDLALLDSDEDDHILSESHLDDNLWEPLFFGGDTPASTAMPPASEATDNEPLSAEGEASKPQIIEQTLF